MKLKKSKKENLQWQQRRLNVTFWLVHSHKINRVGLKPKLVVSNSPKSLKNWFRISHLSTWPKILTYPRSTPHKTLLISQALYTPQGQLSKYHAIIVPTCELVTLATSYLDLSSPGQSLGRSPPFKALTNKPVLNPQSADANKGQANRRFPRSRVDTLLSPRYQLNTQLRVSTHRTGLLVTLTTSHLQFVNLKQNHKLHQNLNHQQTGCILQDPLSFLRIDSNRNLESSSRPKQFHTTKSLWDKTRPNSPLNKPIKKWVPLAKVSTQIPNSPELWAWLTIRWWASFAELKSHPQQLSCSAKLSVSSSISWSHRLWWSGLPWAGKTSMPKSTKTSQSAFLTSRRSSSHLSKHVSLFRWSFRTF